LAQQCINFYTTFMESLSRIGRLIQITLDFRKFLLDFQDSIYGRKPDLGAVALDTWQRDTSTPHYTRADPRVSSGNG